MPVNLERMVDIIIYELFTVVKIKPTWWLAIKSSSSRDNSLLDSNRRLKLQIQQLSSQIILELLSFCNIIAVLLNLHKTQFANLPKPYAFCGIESLVLPWDRESITFQRVMIKQGKS